jgi:hypothetical protein
MLPIESGDHYKAPMSNDCRACGSAQAHVRQSISSDYLLTTRIDAANRNQMLSIFWLPRRPNQIRGGRRGPSKCPAAINCGQSAPLDPMGPVSRDAGEQSAGATPGRRGAPTPPCGSDIGGIHSMRLPKISHAEMLRQSFP